MGFFVAGITENRTEEICVMYWEEVTPINTRTDLDFHLSPVIQVPKSNRLWVSFLVVSNIWGNQRCWVLISRTNERSPLAGKLCPVTALLNALVNTLIELWLSSGTRSRKVAFAGTFSAASKLPSKQVVVSILSWPLRKTSRFHYYDVKLREWELLLLSR